MYFVLRAVFQWPRFREMFIRKLQEQPYHIYANPETCSVEKNDPSTYN